MDRLLPRGSLASYGLRMSETIDTSTPFFLGGVSFGGFVAQKVARHCAPRGLILLSSCRSVQELPPLYRLMGHSAYITPAFAITAAKYFVSSCRKLCGVTDPQQARLFDDMLFATDPRFMRWCIQALLGWRGVEPDGTPILHIHGERDRIIPIARVTPTQCIAQAGHVANLTHATEVNRLIGAWLALHLAPA